jgi:hypothetical protein
MQSRCCSANQTSFPESVVIYCTGETVVEISKLIVLPVVGSKTALVSKIFCATNKLLYLSKTIPGKINTEKRDQFTIFSSTVNLASKLQGLTEKNQIFISEETKNIIKNKFNLKEIFMNPNHKNKMI